MRPYVDTLAALVPAEVLAAHAFILTFTTETKSPGGVDTTSITNPTVLERAWWALLFVPAVLYALGHFAKNWDRWDWVRMLIPSAAFAGWTMGQQTSAFDAVAAWTMEARYVLVAIGSLLLTAGAAALAGKADEKPAAASTQALDDDDTPPE